MAVNDLVTETQVDSLAATVVGDVNSVRAKVGTLASLSTTAKTNLVAAINEVFGIASGGGATNITFSRDGTTVTILSSTGADAILPAADGTNAGIMTSAQQVKLAGIETAADVTDAVNVGSSIHGSAAKATAVDADKIALIDTEASNVLKTLTIAELKNILLASMGAGAPALLNTIDEIAAALGDDPSAITAINTSLGNRLRIDAAQGLTGPQQAQGIANLGLARSVVNFASAYTAAIV